MTTAVQAQVGHPGIVDAQIRDATGVRAEIGPHLVQRLFDPGVHVDRVQSVQDQLALDQRILREGQQQRRVGGHDHLDDTGQPGPVVVDEHADQVLSGGRGPFSALASELSQQRLDALADLLGLTAQQCSPQIASVCCIIAGLWMVWIVLPGPRYMCTPHGRHGSKLRTARMMSMPLKLSGEFSSKIGVF